MIDRKVRVTSVSKAVTDVSVGEIKPFSCFETVRNIILLGDPGSGKSWLLGKACEVAGGDFIKAWQFVLRPDETVQKDYYVDALDEKRSTANNQGMAEKIISKLWRIQPRRFRLSSRLQEWMGDADLSLFKDYFELNGGYIVLEMQPLSDEDIILLLREKNLESPDIFLQQARDKGLGGLLHNPQNLLMLAASLSDGIWPSTRKEIYHAATSNLLSEHNMSKAIIEDAGRLTADELRSAAGELFALRLLADFPGYRLLNDGVTVQSEGLYFHEVRYRDQHKISGALQRRIFQTTDVPGCLDYVHRTIAEFMAGQWLASKIENGFPVGRLEALMGRDGIPVTELRGLFAWLPVFSPTCANYFIAADPIAVIVNGDVFSLLTEQKRALLKSLSEFSARTPWFTTWGDIADQLKALGIPALKEDILALLQAPETTDDMKMALLRMLTQPLSLEKDVRQECRKIVLNAVNQFDHAEEAVHILLADWQQNGSWLRENFIISDIDAETLRLRAMVIAGMPESEITSELMVSLVNEILSFKGNLPFGAFWPLEGEFSPALLLAVIKKLTDKMPDRSSRLLNSSHLYLPARHWALLVLQSKVLSYPEDIEMVLEFISWFYPPMRITKDENNTLKALIEPYWHLIRQGYMEKICTSLAPVDINHLFFSHIHRITMGVFGYLDMVDCFSEYLSTGSPYDSRYQMVYRAALQLSAISNDPRGSKLFFSFYDMADNNPDLAVIREKESVCAIIFPSNEEVEKKAAFSKEKASYIGRLNRLIERDTTSGSGRIRWGILNTVASIYWGRQKYVMHTDQESERLIMLLSMGNIEIIKEAWIEKLTCPDSPALMSFRACLFDGEQHPRLYTYLAAAEEYFAHHQSLEKIEKNMLCLLTAFELTSSVMKFSGDGLRRSAYHFSWHDWLLMHRRELVISTYYALLEQSPGNYDDNLIKQRILRRFLHSEWECTWNKLLHLVRDDLLSTQHILKAIISQAFKDEKQPDFASLYHSYGRDASEPVKALWGAIGYLSGEPELESAFLKIIDSTPDAVFHIRELIGLGEFGEAQRLSLPPESAERLLDALIPRYPEREPMKKHISVSRSSKKYEGEKFVARLIGSTAKNSSSIASAVLQSLSERFGQGVYRDELFQAKHNQMVRRREAEYNQPDWYAVRETLMNKEPANAADLYALICDRLNAFSAEIGRLNTDPWKFFWNEDGHGSVLSPKSENSGTNVLIALLQGYVVHHSVRLEPEQHMAREKRADIAAIHSHNLKLLIEVKRDHHKDVWSAVKEQLLKLYMPDPQSGGYGVFIVFWYGCSQTERLVTLHPTRRTRPASATQMTAWLTEDIPVDLRSRIKCFVIDVSGKK